MPVHLFAALACMFFIFLAAGLLFFRKGQHGLAWFLTLLPFLLGALWLVVFQLRPIMLWVDPASVLYQAMSVLAVVLVCAALLLYGCSLGSHRARIPMWHQKTDSPEKVVSWGVYAHIRHPFYTSYFLLMLAFCLACPCWPTVLIALYCVTMLHLTALREERELLQLFGREYADLMAYTGRFFPRWFTPSSGASTQRG